MQVAGRENPVWHVGTPGEDAPTTPRGAESSSRLATGDGREGARRIAAEDDHGAAAELHTSVAATAASPEARAPLPPSPGAGRARGGAHEPLLDATRRARAVAAQPDTQARMHGFTLRGASLMLGATTALVAAHIAQAAVEIATAGHRLHGPVSLAPLHGVGAGLALGMAGSYALLVAKIARHREAGGDFLPSEVDAVALELEAGGDGSPAAAAAHLKHVHEQRVAAVAAVSLAVMVGTSLVADIAFAPRFAHPCGPAADPDARACRSAAADGIGIAATVMTALATFPAWLWGMAASQLLGVQARAVLRPQLPQAS